MNVLFIQNITEWLQCLSVERCFCYPLQFMTPLGKMIDSCPRKVVRSVASSRYKANTSWGFYVIFVRHVFKQVQKNAETSGGGTAWMSSKVNLKSLRIDASYYAVIHGNMRTLGFSWGEVLGNVPPHTSPPKIRRVASQPPNLGGMLVAAVHFGVMDAFFWAPKKSVEIDGGMWKLPPIQL